MVMNRFKTDDSKPSELSQIVYARCCTLPELEPIDKQVEQEKLRYLIFLLTIIVHSLVVMSMAFQDCVRKHLSFMLSIPSFADRVLYLQGGQLAQWLSGCLKAEWAAILLDVPQYLKNKHHQSGLQVLWGVLAGFLGIVWGEIMITLQGENNEDELAAREALGLVAC
jgi:hypothetical protein